MLKSLIFYWIKVTSKIRLWIDTALGDSHDHYSWYLPAKIGLIASFFLNLFFSGIKLKENQIKALQEIPKNAIVVYVNKFKSHFEYLFYCSRYKKEKLPFPEIGMEYRVLIWQPFSRILKIFFSHIDHFLQEGSFPDPYVSGYIQKELTGGKVGFLSLVEKRGFYRRFVKEKTDPIQYLIEIQKMSDRPVYIVPQLMFFGKKPQRSSQNIMNFILGSETNP